MPVQVEKRRQVGRRWISTFQYAEIKFTGPDGTAHKWPLIELSLNGGSFQLPERIPGLEVGAAIDGSVIWMDEFEIHVNFAIRHVTPDDGKRYRCGMQFHTMGHQARKDMAALVSRLQLHQRMT